MIMRSKYRGVLGAAVLMAMVLTLAGSALAVPVKPSITSITPTSGKVGAKVTITGKNLTGTEAVQIGGITAAFKVGSATKITATVPKKGKTGKITLTTLIPPGPTYYATTAKSFTVTK